MKTFKQIIGICFVFCMISSIQAQDTLKVYQTCVEPEPEYEPEYESPLAQWNGFILEALEDSTVVSFTIKKDVSSFSCSSISGNFYYSYDAVNWKEWTCSTNLLLNKGHQIALKGNRSVYGKLDKGYYGLSVLSGSCKEYGYINSLFENSDANKKTSFPDVALEYFFIGNHQASLEFPEGVKTLGSTNIYSYAFGRNSITEVHLPSTLTFIGATCFEHALITEITIPKSVTQIGYYAFHYCTKLTTVNYLGTKADWAKINKNQNYKGYNVPATVVHCTDGDVSF